MHPQQNPTEGFPRDIPYQETIYTEQSVAILLASPNLFKPLKRFGNTCTLTDRAGTSPSGNWLPFTPTQQTSTWKRSPNEQQTHLRQTMLDLAEGRLRFANRPMRNTGWCGGLRR